MYNFVRCVQELAEAERLEHSETARAGCLHSPAREEHVPDMPFAPLQHGLPGVAEASAVPATSYSQVWLDCKH